MINILDCWLGAVNELQLLFKLGLSDWQGMFKVTVN